MNKDFLSGYSALRAGSTYNYGGDSAEREDLLHRRAIEGDDQAQDALGVLAATQYEEFLKSNYESDESVYATDVLAEAAQACREADRDGSERYPMQAYVIVGAYADQRNMKFDVALRTIPQITSAPYIRLPQPL